MTAKSLNGDSRHRGKSLGEHISDIPDAYRAKFDDHMIGVLAEKPGMKEFYDACLAQGLDRMAVENGTKDYGFGSTKLAGLEFWYICRKVIVYKNKVWELERRKDRVK
jgi:hypothetical protein